MRIYYIRHAPTEANLSGEMVKDYNSYSILLFDAKKWHEKVGINLPKDFKLFVSPAKRCQETANVLFPKHEFKILNSLEEFDCSALNGKKFWEISEKEFNQITQFDKKEMLERCIEMLCEVADNSNIYDNIVLIGHGFYGRMLCSYWREDNDSVYDILNSKNFQLRNLDMVCSVDNKEIKNVWRWK